MVGPYVGHASSILTTMISFADHVVVAVVFLLVSSSISMSIPSVARNVYIPRDRLLTKVECERFSIGKLLDIATNHSSSGDKLFGLELSQFYIALAGVRTTARLTSTHPYYYLASDCMVQD